MQNKPKPYTAIIVIGISLIAVGAILAIRSPGFLAFIGTGTVFIILGIAESKQHGSSGGGHDSSE